MKKRIFALCLACVMAASMAACGDSEDSSKSSKKSKKSKDSSVSQVDDKQIYTFCLLLGEYSCRKGRHFGLLRKRFRNSDPYSRMVNLITR